jgi:dihydroorotase
VSSADVGVEGGRIQAIAAPGRLFGAEALDCRNLLVFPGAIDAHVHFRDPGLTYKEDWESGSAAAVLGGVTTVFDMPNTNPPVTSPEDLRAKSAAATGRSYVDFGLYALVADANLDAMPALHREGAVGFKGYLAVSASGMPLLTDGALMQALRMTAHLGTVVTVHAENQGMLEEARQRVETDEGRTDWAAHCAARPPYAEEEAVWRATMCAGAATGRLHIAHLSTAGGARAVCQARRRGINVTAEVTPFHLLNSQADSDRLGPASITNPPLRSPDDVRALWRALVNQAIDIVATDHAPHSPAEKLRPILWEVKSGNPGVQTMLPLMVHQALMGRLRLEDVARCCSERVADLFRLSPWKGRIAVGADADFAIIDPRESWRIEGGWLRSKIKLTPFEGVTIRGLPRFTVLRGQVVMADGTLLGKPSGQRVTRSQDSSLGRE